ncbi:hypothetical protein MJT46_001737 [Ovis ammon polii x Ovis aries]|nr:hypothetical protein MJT46_001737 [Ovis ammon polii x Ovis aries]
MCQRSLADLPRGKQWYQHIPEGSVSNLRFSLRTEASHTQARMPDPSWYCYEASLHLGSLGPPRARLESAATGQATDTGSQEDRSLQTRSRGKQRSGFYPFSPDAGKLGDTGGLNAAYTYVLIPVLLLDTGDRGLLEPEGPTAEGALDQAPGGIATPPVYGQLLALYLLHNDMNNARYLWKRIPPAIKSANSELGGIWSVGQRIWQRDFPGIYSTINAHQWSEAVQPIMEALRDATRRRAFALVSQAYTSIIADDFAAFVGLPVEEAVKGILEQGWQADSTTRMVMPKKPVAGALDVSFNRFIPLSEPAPVPPIPNEQQLARLTDYVAFLEN